MHMTEENLGILVTFYQFMPLRHKDSVGVKNFRQKFDEILLRLLIKCVRFGRLLIN